MGKWTPNYHDDILHTKISTLVTSAVRRAAFDNDPNFGNVTYENFVQDLDPGDSFAATMIDIMVKELAERRLRPQSHTDRRSLSHRTIKSLRQLATPFNHFPQRMRSRRAFNSVLYPDEDMDEDNFDLMLAEATTQSNNLNTIGPADVYEAMQIPWPRRSEDASSSVRTTAGPSAVRSPPSANRTGPWTVLPAPSTLPITLTRQASIRRPFNNSRNIEFNNFTRRHRLAHREGAEGEAATAESVTEPRDDPWTTRATNTSSSARRFFPPVAARRIRRAAERTGYPRNAVDVSDGTSSGDDESLNTVPIGANGYTPFTVVPVFPVFDPASPVPPPPPPPAQASASEEQGDYGSTLSRLNQPRLRRGGVFAPELIVSPQNATPPTEVVPPATARTGPEQQPEASTSAAGSSQNVAVVEEAFLLSGEPPAAYPTPGSSSGEHSG